MKHQFFAVAGSMAALTAILLTGCQNDVSPIGSSIFNGEVNINVDSLTMKVAAESVKIDKMDARSTTNLLGQFNIPVYGRMSASYVCQLLSASRMSVPDSIGVERVDSMKMFLDIPRDLIIGDSLAPQQLNVYRLIRQLPSGIQSDFDPSGYYDPSDVVATRNYTLSGLALSDSAFRNTTTLQVSFPLPKRWAVDAFNAYRAGSEVFDWPASFNQAFPGLYVRQTFGKGAMANISATKLYTYYHYYATRNVVENNEVVTRRVTMKDSVCLFRSAPEVISSSILDFEAAAQLNALVASGKKLLSAPLGYRLRFTFPAAELLEQYWASDPNLSVINNLTFTLPVESITNDYGLLPPAEVLMVRTSDLEDFFAQGKVPDNRTSFRGTYSASRGRYEFTSMRQYIVDLKDNYPDNGPEATDFTLVPVTFETESNTSSYYGTTTTYVTACTPYLEKPAVAIIDTDHAGVVFTFTQQLIK